MTENFRRNFIPLIVATALFMENLDATVLATSLPAMAKDLGSNPIHLKLALTTYLLALAVFIPASGWMADRFGAKNVFRAAMVVFAAGSIACGVSSDLGSLVASRILQGIGGAMMTPVGRLIVLRTVPRTDIINAIAWLTVPALVGPVLGPPLGGFLTTYFNWRWIFWINIPLGVAALALLLRADLGGPAEREGDGILEHSLTFNLAADIADDPAQPPAQDAQRPLMPLELLGMGIGPRHHPLRRS